MRIGIGYDLHRLIPSVERAAIALAGVEIPCYFTVQAHSDGDVVLHALTDAILGALALGDIGQWFPDNKPENKNRASTDFVTQAVREARRLGYEVVNVDSVVMLEEPKLVPHFEVMRRRIAELVGTELTSVSVKAKTMEGMGPVGERKAIASTVVVLLKSVSHQGRDAHSHHQ